MALKFVCDQTAAEVTSSDLDPATHLPKLPDGWVQEVIKQQDGSFVMRHFSSFEEQKNWHDANPNP